ncbi:MAG: radical SAM family heme chaperone HemW [Spirochaetes bacterium]|nr:radical SAM family heme chaperone HemW [Spirochaetota bacterium]
MDLACYIHIPFCRSKCSYCDFYSKAGSSHLIRPYLKGVVQEMTGYKAYYNLRAKTIYIGGGTPSCLPPGDLEYLLKGIHKIFSVNNIEFTIEVNPESLSRTFLTVTRAYGVNRYSLGVQSFQDRILKILKRKTTSDTIKKSLAFLGKEVNNFSADLIYGLPFQTQRDLENDLECLLDHPVKHISLYALTLPEKSLIHSLYLKDRGIFPSEEEIAEMYFMASALLNRKKYIRYEISNYARKGYVCRHNMTYWQGKDYIGWGAAAVSTVGGIRWSNVSDISGYIACIKKGGQPIRKKTVLQKNQIIREYIMLQMRLKEGLNLLYLDQRYGIDLSKTKAREMEKWIELGLVKLKKNILSLTTSGVMVSNSIISDLMI